MRMNDVRKNRENASAAACISKTPHPLRGTMPTACVFATDSSDRIACSPTIPRQLMLKTNRLGQCRIDLPRDLHLLQRRFALVSGGKQRGVIHVGPRVAAVEPDGELRFSKRFFIRDPELLQQE